MNKTGSAAKVKLNSFDDLFGDGQPQAGTNGGKRQGAWSVDARHRQTDERWRL